MCDTLVALPNATRNRCTLFAKNSDRDPNEAHLIEKIEAQKHAVGDTVKCQYIEIPQVKNTFAVLLAKPFWIWGAEMGTNEHGVTIGNEAVFTRVNDSRKPRLQGMDLLRLALERSRTSEEALHVIVRLLEVYGQGGNCGFSHPFYYDNSFLIADADEAWVLETAGRQWAAERVKDVRSISNRLSIGSKWDLASTDIVRYAQARGWCRARSEFNFQQCYSDPIMNFFSGSAYRQACTQKNLLGKLGNITPRDMMLALRTHAPSRRREWTPDRSLFESGVCMHIGAGPVRINQTTGSMVSEIGKQRSLHWFTGTSTPCLSIFKPVWFETGFPAEENTPSGSFSAGNIWWQHERFVRQAFLRFPEVLNMVKNDQQEIEKEFDELLEKSKTFTKKDKREYSKKIMDSSRGLLSQWVAQSGRIQPRQGVAKAYLRMIRKINREAEMIE